MSFRWVQAEKLAWGWQPEIWLVRDPFLNIEAVQRKLRPAPGHPGPDAEVRRFMREVRCQSRLSERHPGIMPIHGSNFNDSPPWYVMPRASETLRAPITRNPGGMDTDLACDDLRTVADAVGYAHQQGIYHRDLNPENILLLNDRWVVGDFGLCRDLTADSTTFTQSNTVVGSVVYMAPEQFDNGHEIGPQADVYALGRILYHMLSGQRPFPHQRPELVPAEFASIVEVATRENPADRFATVSEFSRELVQARRTPACRDRRTEHGRRRTGPEPLSIFKLTEPYVPSPAHRADLSSSSAGRAR